ncbi:MAG: hypothetical protein QNJ00_14175 [Woeseiaceae bacterium]|nr:hypothetical protein [Woeseiaceae bacterium]
MATAFRAIPKPGLVPGFFLLALFTACDEPPTAASDEGRPARLSLAGELENPDLREASGMTTSQRDPKLLWLHNDSGAKARLYAIDHRGRHRGRLTLDDAKNRDWEDVTSFTLDGTPYLLVADIGDNDARHEAVTLYVVEEPDLSDDNKQRADIAWKIRFRYPDGPRDAESVAVDIANERVLVLSKRELPPALYSVPLRPADDEVIVATRLGEVTSLPPPSRQDREIAPKTKNWHWQPTSMDLARDGSAAVILTYAAVYYFAFDGNDWHSTVNQPALAFDIRHIRDSEAIGFSADATSLFLTVEKKHAPLFRIDMRPEE